MTKVKVGVAAGRKYENYLKWILQEPDIEVIKLGHEDKNLHLAEQCDGLVLSGGEDVHPRFYNKPHYVNDFHLDDFDEARDEFELRILEVSQSKKLPLLGICRGLQIANVYFGGTLVGDIPSSGKPDHTKFSEGNDRIHKIRVTRNSLLSEVAGSLEGEVNSAHHQSVDLAADSLQVNAVSPDGIVEGMERKELQGRSYLMLVQWHPERMADQGSPFSRNIRESFVKHVKGQRL